MEDQLIRKRVIVFVVAMVILVVASTIGYIFIKKFYEDEDASFIDAIYWTIATITTMGATLPEVRFTTDIGKVYTVVVVLLGIFIIFTSIPLIVAPWLELQVKKVTSPESVPLPEENHVIIWGYTEIGKEVIDDLELHDIPYVIIDEDAGLESKMVKAERPFIAGDPDDPEVLKNAYIDGALSLVVVKGDEKNATICLTAREINQNIPIIACVNEEQNEIHLTSAGATKVIFPRSSSGVLLANLGLSQYDVSIKGKIALLGELEIGQEIILAESPFVNKTLNETRIRQKTGATIIGLWKNGVLIISPSSRETLPLNTILVTLGTPDQLSKLRKILSVELPDRKRKRRGKNNTKSHGGSR